MPQDTNLCADSYYFDLVSCAFSVPVTEGVEAQPCPPGDTVSVRSPGLSPVIPPTAGPAVSSPSPTTGE